MERAIESKLPRAGARVYLAASAIVVGDVELGDDVSIWHHAVIRGDIEAVRVGARCNLQDAVVVHVENAIAPTLLAEEISVGHGAILHGCTVGRGCLIGMGATILNHAVIGELSIVAAGAVVRESFEAPPHSLIVGVPAVVKRQLRPDEIARAQTATRYYLEYKSRALSEIGWQPTREFAPRRNE